MENSNRVPRTYKRGQIEKLRKEKGKDKPKTFKSTCIEIRMTEKGVGIG